MGNQIRVCTTACQNPIFLPIRVVRTFQWAIRSESAQQPDKILILYPPKLEVECLCILARNQIYLSSYGWLLIANIVRISYRRGAFIKVNVGQ